MRSRKMDFATHILLNLTVRIPDRISPTCRIDIGVRGVKYDWRAYPSPLLYKRSSGSTQRGENPIVGVGARPVELIATGYPMFNVFCAGVTAGRGISLPNLF